jgi:hypothetical protein
MNINSSLQSTSSGTTTTGSTYTTVSSTLSIPPPTYEISVWLTKTSIAKGQQVFVRGNFTNTSSQNQSIVIKLVGPTLYPSVYFQNGTLAWSWTQNKSTQTQYEYSVAAGQTISLFGYPSSISSKLAAGMTYVVETMVDYYVLTPGVYGQVTGNIGNLTVT